MSDPFERLGEPLLHSVQQLLERAIPDLVEREPVAAMIVAHVRAEYVRALREHLDNNISDRSAPAVVVDVLQSLVLRIAGYVHIGSRSVGGSDTPWKL